MSKPADMTVLRAAVTITGALAKLSRQQRTATMQKVREWMQHVNEMEELAASTRSDR